MLKFELTRHNLSLVALAIVMPLAIGYGGAEGANPEHVQQLKSTKRCERCDLSGANFSGIDLSGAKMMDSDLTNTNFSGANLAGAELMLSNASGANFSKTCLVNANLAGVVFIKANLRQANIRGSNLNGANFERAKVRGVLADVRLPSAVGQSKDTDDDDQESFNSCPSVNTGSGKPSGRRIF
jgi:uncharacterized protein YjbI with pentapeptide repeats